MEAEILELAARLGEEALKRGAVLATAESCTAGGISFAITAVPGSSAWFDRGFVTYTPESKEEMLGVRHDVIATHGVVSEEVARSMAEGAVARSRATIAVSVTGIAGPGGAEPGKPVGTVCFGFARKGGNTVSSVSFTGHFPGDRGEVRDAVVRQALLGLLDTLRSKSSS